MKRIDADQTAPSPIDAIHDLVLRPQLVFWLGSHEGVIELPANTGMHAITKESTR